MPVDKATCKKNNPKRKGREKSPERGLGRGLSSLLGDQGVAIATGIKGQLGEGSVIQHE